MPVATYTFQSAPTLTSDVAFRKWAKGIRDALVAVGLVQTADTGQVDLDTMIPPVGINATAGYVILAFADALQASKPIYLKIEFGRGANSGDAPVFWTTIGRATNGAGVLSGLLLARTASSTTSSSFGSVTEYVSYVSGDGSGFNLAMWAGYNGNGSVFLTVERSRAADGSVVGESVAIGIASTSGAGSGIARVIAWDGTIDAVRVADAGELVALPGRINGQTTTGTPGSVSPDGVVAPVFPVVRVAPGCQPWVSSLLLGVMPGDAAVGGVLTAATINGQARTYRAWTHQFAQLNGAIVRTAYPPSIAAAGYWPAIAWA